MKKIVRFIFLFIDKLQKAHIGAYAAQAAYFIVLSGIPLLMMLLALIQYTPLTKSMLLEMFSSFLPSVLMPFIIAVMDEVYTKSVTLISITAIIAFWSGARGMLAITAGCNNIYGVKETRNYFILRLRSAVHTLILLVAVIVAMLLFVFSEQRLDFLAERFVVVDVIMNAVGKVRFLMALAIELCIFLFIYKLVPNRKGKLGWQIPGALFAAVGWSGFSYFYSIYVGGFSNMSYMYGSLTTIIIFMLWIYTCMYILLIGAGINACIERYPRWRKWEKIRKKEEKTEVKAAEVKK
ncbi:MAG: YihY/virulence factor BrkB family protein [Lachnospiraceae bacterium]|nr:YihY/virulence factor BrkB family protein [Lachnospiraceae bacterium]